MLFVTDPERTPDPAAIARRLPRGSGIVYRAFGAPDALGDLTAIARRTGLTLLIGADERLARKAAAQGLHLPERLVHRLPRLRARYPRWLITTAAHSPAAVRRAARLGADAVLLSTIFESRSPSAGRPIGPIRLAAIARSAPVPVYALGGVGMKNARRLLASSVVGIAAVDAFRT